MLSGCGDDDNKSTSQSGPEVTSTPVVIGGGGMASGQEQSSAQNNQAHTADRVAPESFRQYVVQRGDNLTRIALAFGTTVAAIATANGITNPDFIREGTTLSIPIVPPADQASATSSPPTPEPLTGGPAGGGEKSGEAGFSREQYEASMLILSTFDQNFVNWLLATKTEVELNANLGSAADMGPFLTAAFVEWVHTTGSAQ